MSSFLSRIPWSFVLFAATLTGCAGSDVDFSGATSDSGPAGTFLPCGGAGATIWYTDADGDGFGDPASATVACEAPAGDVALGTDCDDTRPDLNPGETDIPADGIDQDCSGDGACDTLTWTAGDVRIATEEDAAALCGTANAVNGLLDISDSTLTDLSSLDCLCAVSGDLRISYNQVLKRVDSFPYLMQIGGDLDIFANGTLESVDGFPNLLELSGIWMYENQDLTDVDGFPALRAVDGPIYLFSDDALNAIGGFDALETIGESLTIERNPALSSLGSFDSLRSIKSDLSIADDQALTEIFGFDALQTVSGSLDLREDTALESIRGFSSLEGSDTDLDGAMSIYITSDPALATVTGFERVMRTGTLLIKGDVALLSMVDFGSLRTVDGDLTLSELGALTALPAMPALVSVSGALNLEDLGVRSLAGLENLETATGLSITDNPNLTDASALDGLMLEYTNTGPTSLTLTGNDALTALTGVDASTSEQISILSNASLEIIRGLDSMPDASLDVEDNPALLQIEGLGSLATVKDLTLVDNASLQTLPDFGALTRLSGMLTVTGNDALPSLSGFDALTEIDHGAVISQNTAMAEIDGLGALVTVKHGLTIQGNPSLSSLAGLASLRSVSGEDLSIIDNDALANLDGLERLHWVGKNLVITYNDALTDVLGCSGLGTIGGELTIGYNTSLPTANAEELADDIGASHIGGGTSIVGNAP